MNVNHRKAKFTKLITSLLAGIALLSLSGPTQAATLTQVSAEITPDAVAFHIGWDAAPDFVTIGPHGQPADQFRVAIMAFNPYFPSGSSFGIAGMTEHTAYFVIAERTASLFIDGSLGNLTYGLPFQPPLGWWSSRLVATSSKDRLNIPRTAHVVRGSRLSNNRDL